MRTRKEILSKIADAYDCSDGHYFDSDECWYCGYRDGIIVALMYVLGHCDLEVDSESHKIQSTGVKEKDLLEIFQKVKGIK